MSGLKKVSVGWMLWIVTLAACGGEPTNQCLDEFLNATSVSEAGKADGSMAPAAVGYIQCTEYQSLQLNLPQCPTAGSVVLYTDVLAFGTLGTYSLDDYQLRYGNCEEISDFRHPLFDDRIQFETLMCQAFLYPKVLPQETGAWRSEPLYILAKAQVEGQEPLYKVTVDTDQGTFTTLVDLKVVWGDPSELNLVPNRYLPAGITVVYDAASIVTVSTHTTVDGKSVPVTLEFFHLGELAE